MDTETFLDHLRAELLEPAGVGEEDIALEAWIYGPGLPGNAPVFDSESFRKAGQEAAALVEHAVAEDLDTDGWNSQQWVAFIRALPADLDTARMADLDRAFRLSHSGNGEILCAWFQLAINNDFVFASPEADEALASFLTRQGRLKYIRPLYTLLAASPEGLARAKLIYADAREGYHPISAGSIDKILAWQ